MEVANAVRLIWRAETLPAGAASAPAGMKRSPSSPEIIAKARSSIAEAGAHTPSGAGQEKLPAMFPPRLAQPPRAKNARSVGALPARRRIGFPIMGVPP